MMKFNRLCLFTFAFSTLSPFWSASMIADALEVTQGLSAMRLANMIAGSNVMVKDASLVGYEEQSGIFTDGQADLGIDRGVLLASTSLEAALDLELDLPLGGQGYRPLTNLLNGTKTKDAATLQFTFKCQDEAAEYVSFRYVFASNEYPTTGGHSDHEDVMGAFLNGMQPENNVASVNGKYVSVATLYKGSKYVDNTNHILDDLDVNGLTIPLSTKQAKVRSSGNWNTLTVAVADGGGDNALGSFVFIEKDSLSCY